MTEVPPVDDECQALKLDYDVVIPTVGTRPALLMEAIDSVQAQRIAPRHVFVVVDGNPSLAAALPELRPEVTVLNVPTREGPAVARQIGIEAATADWVAFLDDDDLWSVRKQEVMAWYVAQHPECAAVCSGYWTVTGSTSNCPPINGQEIELRGDGLADLEAAALHAVPRNDLRYLDIKGDSLGLLLEFNRGNIGSSMVRRTVLQQIDPVPPGTQPGEDHLLFCSVAAETEWHLVKERLIYYRLHAEQITRHQGGEDSGAERLIRSKVLAWERAGANAPRPVETYGRLYRTELRRLMWPSLKTRRLATAARTFRAARPLLPRRVDRFLALIPEPLIWRLHRLGSAWSQRNGLHT